MSNETIFLAKQIEEMAAGDKAPDLRAVIQSFPQIRLLYLAAAVRCLDAHRSYWDKANGQMVHEGEGATIMKAVAWLSAYDAGLPMQTSVNLNLGGDKGPTLEEAANSSPALVEALEKALDQARRRRGKAIKQVEATQEEV